ncbi:MAG TPA: AAA-like domain-containing protein [Blastocatellia bacterium]|nr:AAA-like domain-containing protein [Blastocatellia bacterium]
MSESSKKRIFISYKRNVSPDNDVALEVFQALCQQHQVFIDQTMSVGTLWAQQIEEELAKSDFLITFLSEHSVTSEMVKGEIETAHNLFKKQGRPRILPVRLDYHEPLQYPLSAYLNPINWALWTAAQGTSRLIEELQRGIAGGELLSTTASSLNKDIAPIPAPFHSAQPLPLDLPEGTIDLESRFYIQRTTDKTAIDAIRRKGGVTITIKGPRQMGKSSLLMRTIQTALDESKRVAFLDFQLFDKSALANADLFFQQFCSWLSDELEMENRVAEYWALPLGNSQRCERYMSRYLLKELGAPLVLAMDEVESIFETEFRTDFFSMLRSWHNGRAKPTTPIWKLLDLTLVTSTEPYQLIENLNQSPFNVGEVIDLRDFTPEEVAELNHRHRSPFTSEGVNRLLQLLNGHPYLTRRALYLVASGRLSSADLFAHATDDQGPFGDHLRYHLFRLHKQDALINGLRQVIRQHNCQDEKIFFRLRGAGLVRREGNAEFPRCQLYADYFQEFLHV